VFAIVIPTRLSCAMAFTSVEPVREPPLQLMSSPVTISWQLP
jgi:hypothetical protein